MTIMSSSSCSRNTTLQQTTATPPPPSLSNGNGKSVCKDIFLNNNNKTTTMTACKREEEEEDDTMMTLEDFLAKAEVASTTVLEDDDVKIPSRVLSNERMFSFNNHSNLDKAAQQRQKRMIKNRESAARSRERKQAYQTQLESLALKLEQDNHTLSVANMQRSRTRYKQLMDNVIPVTEKRRPPTRYVLRKVRSMEW